MAGAVPERGLTIDELARAAGTTSRNVRAYQERGLLPPPRKVGRTGYYDPPHLERLQTIARLLSEGFSLAAIGSLLEAWDSGDSLGDVLGFEQALTAPYSDESPTTTTSDELYRLLPGEAEAGERAGRAAIAAGLLVELGDGRVEVTSPRVIELGLLLHELGVPVDALADEVVALRHDVDRIAERFVRMFLEHIWGPFEAAGAPVADLPRVTTALERSRPVPAEATAALLAQAMRHEMDAVVGRLLEVAHGHRGRQLEATPRAQA